MTLGSVLPETSLVLDTNIVTAWRYRKSGVVTAITDYQSRLKLLPALTSITVHETLYGFENKARRLESLMTELGRIASRSSN